MKRLIYLTIFVATNSYAHCRVAGNDIVCDNSNTLIETYQAIVRPMVVPVPVYIVNQPVYLPQIQSGYDFNLIYGKPNETMPKVHCVSCNQIQTR